jgi:Tfp pilus assembly protein PilF
MKPQSWRLSQAALGTAALLAVAVVPASAAPPATAPAAVLDARTLYDVLLGEMAAQRGQLGIAADAWNRAAQRTRDPRFVERAALAAIAAKQYGDAESTARLWIELEPSSIEARETLAAALVELGRLAEATEQFAQQLAVEAAGGNIDASYLRIAGALGRASNRNAALTVMQDLSKRHPHVAAGHFALAHLAVRAGDFAAAEVAADRALAKKPDWQEAALFKARILVSRNQTGQALRYFNEFLTAHPGATYVRLHYARQLIDQKQWELAREQFKRVVADTPEDAEATYAVGLLALQTNRLDDAETYLKRALALRPENDQARLYLGQAAEQGKRYVDAGRWYGEIAAGEHYFEAQLRLGIVLAKTDLGKARAHLRAIGVSNDQQRVQVALAEEQVLRDARQYREALEMLNGAITQVPGDKDLLYARALIAERLDLLNIAEADLRAILKFDPKNVHALNALGYTLADRTDRYAESQALLSQALEIKPDDPFVLDSMGWLLYRQGNRGEAVKYLKRALQQRSDAEIAAHLGEVLWVSGERNEAESVWTRALRDTPDSEVLREVIRKFKQ